MSDGNGALPEGWEKVGFGELVENHDRTRIPLKQSDRAQRQGEYRYYGASGVIDQIDDFLFDGEYLLIAEDGANLLARSTPIAFQAHGQFWVNNHAHVVQPHDGISRDYLEHHFNSMSIREYVTGSAQPKLTQKKLSGIPIRVAPLAEQRRIVSKIESLQERSSRARRALSEVGPLLEQFRQSVLRAAFSGRLTADWRAARRMGTPARPSSRAKGSGKSAQATYEPATELLSRIRTERRHRWEQSELAKYEAKGKQPPKNWQDKRYKEAESVDTKLTFDLPDGWCWATIDTTSFVTKLAGFEYTKFVNYEDDGDLAVIKAENAGPLGFRHTDFSRIHSSTVAQLTRSQVIAGDVLMVFVGAGVGQVGCVPDDQPYFLGPNISMIRIESSFLRAKYLEHFLRSPIGFDFAMSFTKAVAQPSLSMETIRKIPVPIPPIEEQQEIETLVEAAIERVVEVEGVLAESESALTQLDQSILAKAFHGELVPQDPRDEPASELLARIRTTRE